MSEMLDIDQPTSGSFSQFGVRCDPVAANIHEASAGPTGGVQSRPADWERWIVHVSQWQPDAGTEDCDGVVWPTEQAIRSAYQIIGQMRSKPLAEPTDIVPSGDGGIVISRRTGNSRLEIEVSDSGEAELLLFADGRLVHPKP